MKLDIRNPNPNPDSDPIPQFLPQYQNETYLHGWSKLWDIGDNLNWDLGFPNPALEDTLVQHQCILGSPIITTNPDPDPDKEKKRKKALVPGCGRGVDVLLLASFGYDAYGLDCQSAVNACKTEYARATAMNQYPVRDVQNGRGTVTFVKGDFFQDAWLEVVGLGWNSFDLIYDHSFFCALSPRLRPSWALRQAQLLAGHGHLICLEYPRHKDLLELGPPFASPSEVYLNCLGCVEEGLEDMDCNSRQGLVRVVHWTPSRTHANGIDSRGVVQDRISIWRK